MTARLTPLDLYRQLVLIRHAEERIREEYSRDEMKTPVHLGIGAEAIAVGVCAALPPTAKVFGTYRNHGIYLALTADTDGFFAELYGKATGSAKGKAGSMHLSAPSRGLMATSAVVGTTIPLAVGAALASVYRRSSEVVAVFFGDGAVEEGVFWESLNFASLRRLPVLFVCEDNGLAIHALAAERRGYTSLVDVVQAFGCHVVAGDGADLRAVMGCARAALTRMTDRPGPALLHLSYLRFLEHVGPSEDFDCGYRPRPSSAERADRDPLLRFETTLREEGIVDEELARVRREVDAQIDASVRAARAAAFPAPAELTTDVWA